MLKKTSKVLFLLFFMILVGTPAIAADPTPESLDGANVVDDAFVKANFKKMKVYDVRKKAEYVEGHIQGAISVPYKEKSAKAVDFDASKDHLKMSDFPADKNEAFIVYCNGPRCWKSYKAAVLLIRDGYTNVNWYRNDGYPSWKSKGNPVE